MGGLFSTIIDKTKNLLKRSWHSLQDDNVCDKNVLTYMFFFLPHGWALFCVSRLQINLSGAQSGYTSWLILNIILKFSCYLSFSKLVFPITSFFLMNAMDQKGLDFTLDKAVQKYLQSDTKQSIAIIY